MTILQANILGVEGRAITMEMALRIIEGWLARRESHDVW